MSERYKVRQNYMPHFITCTVTAWADALSRPEYKDIVLESLKYCREHKGLLIHAWVIMSNHIHLIVSAREGAELPSIIRDFKKFTSSKIVSAIAECPQESRKKWLLNLFSFAGKGELTQFWQKNYHPIELNTDKLFQQRLDYLHENPVKAGLVREHHHYLYSSAIDYYEEKQGLLEIDIL